MSLPLDQPSTRSILVLPATWVLASMKVLKERLLPASSLGNVGERHKSSEPELHEEARVRGGPVTWKLGAEGY